MNKYVKKCQNLLKGIELEALIKNGSSINNNPCYIVKVEEIIDIILKINKNLSEDDIIKSVYYFYKNFGNDIIFPTSDVISISSEHFVNKFNVKGKLKKIIENLHTQLGKKTEYIDTYNPELIFPVSRQESHDRINYRLDDKVQGIDIWCAYEFSGLDLKGRPYNYILKLGYDSQSTSIVESKSLKLYLNSFNQEKIDPRKAKDIIKKDLQERLQTNIIYVELINNIEQQIHTDPCIDNIKFEGPIEYDTVNPDLIVTFDSKDVNSVDRFYTNALKSNCRHSGLPDWGTLTIEYSGSKMMTRESFLRYIISYRNHKGFHEECVEQILNDLVKVLDPAYLYIRANYTRRGGIDINPIRLYVKCIEQVDMNAMKAFCDSEYKRFKREARQ